jgi:hypothetical protein
MAALANVLRDQLSRVPAERHMSGGDHGSELPGLANLRRDFATFTKTRAT